MLKILEHADKIKDEFYLDDDDITIRRKKDGYYGRFKKHDIVVPYKFKSSRGFEYEGIHIPRTRTTIAVHWILTLLRGIKIKDGSVIDHIDGNTKNNSRENLRVTTQSINCRNRKLRCDNKTGYAGITLRNNTYLVRRQINGERKHARTKSFDRAIEIWNEFNELAKKHGEAYIDI